MVSFAGLKGSGEKHYVANNRITTGIVNNTGDRQRDPDSPRERQSDWRQHRRIWALDMSDIWSWNNAVDAEGTLDLQHRREVLEGCLRPTFETRALVRYGARASMPATLNIALAASGAVSMFGVFGTTMPRSER